jgi:ligand-binding SRPBCC domain-containing protein
VGIIRVETHISASPQRCFDLARDLKVHTATTGKTQERIVSGPDRLLELGDEVTFEAQHLGIRQRLTARIVAFDPPHSFTDEMVKGAFRRLRHEHRFQERDGGTVMTDILDFQSPVSFFDRLFLDGYMRRFLIARGKALAALAL